MQFLFDSAETDFRGSEADVNAVDRLIVTSGKMVLLDKLLRRLKDTGHRWALRCQGLGTEPAGQLLRLPAPGSSPIYSWLLSTVIAACLGPELLLLDAVAAGTKGWSLPRKGLNSRRTLQNLVIRLAGRSPVGPTHVQACRRVLIFSQMVRVLDIVSDYMRLRGFVHQRLDGSTPAAARHQVIPALQPNVAKVARYVASWSAMLRVVLGSSHACQRLSSSNN